mmetsp:Transcript_119116/g.218096  ORF Transcript_119116/g.218096 Transcript_119116/m.218096 type:complete len:597 (+) Transcript_119116:112-1902(+)
MVETQMMVDPALSWLVVETAKKGGEKEYQKTHLLPSPYALVGAACEPMHRVVQVSLGAEHGIMLTDAGVVFTWGDNRFGQRGRPARLKEENNRPFEVLDLVDHEVIAVAAGKNHCLALIDNGLVKAWGRNKSGQVGVGDTRDKVKPEYVCLAPRTSEGDSQRLGDGPLDRSTGKTPAIRSISAGGNSSIAAAENSDVWQWGEISEDFKEFSETNKKKSQAEAGKVRSEFPFLVACQKYQSFRSHMRKEIRDRVCLTETNCLVLPDSKDVEYRNTVKEYVEQLQNIQAKVCEERGELQRILNSRKHTTEKGGASAEEDAQDVAGLEDTKGELMRDIETVKREISLYEGSLQSCEQQQNQNRKQLEMLMHQGYQLTETQGKCQSALLEPQNKGPDKKRIEEKLAEIRNFIDANQNTRATLLDQRAEIEKEKQKIVTQLTKRKEEGNKLETRLKTVQDLSAKEAEAKGGSDTLVSFGAEVKDKYAAHFDENKAMPHELIGAKLKLEKDEIFLQGIQRQVDEGLKGDKTSRERVQSVKDLLLEVVTLRRNLNNLVSDKYLKEDLNLQTFFKGAKSPNFNGSSSHGYGMRPSSTALTTTNI